MGKWMLQVLPDDDYASKRTLEVSWDQSFIPLRIQRPIGRFNMEDHNSGGVVSSLMQHE